MYLYSYIKMKSFEPSFFNFYIVFNRDWMIFHWGTLRIFFTRIRIRLYLKGRSMLKREFNFYRLQNLRKIVRRRVKLLHLTGTFAKFFAPLRFWHPQMPVHLFISDIFNQWIRKQSFPWKLIFANFSCCRNHLIIVCNIRYVI